MRSLHMPSLTLAGMFIRDISGTRVMLRKRRPGDGNAAEQGGKETR